MKYIEQLKTPEWQAKRRKIIRRDGGKCTQCNTKKTLQVHHLKYINGKKAWEVPDEFLITLCEKHHKEIHFGKPIKDFVKGKPLESKQEYAFRMALEKEVNKNNRIGAEPQKIKRKDVARIVQFFDKKAEQDKSVMEWWNEFKTKNR
jgi:hypothetical protein